MSRRGFATLAGASLLPLSLAACGQNGGGSGFPSKTIRIMAPAKAGGGWDTTARTVQEVIKKAKLTDQSVEVYNKEAAAGMQGLAEFVTEHQGDMHELMITGLVMVGGIVANASTVSLSQTTVIATLTAEQEVFVVPKDSPYETINDVLEAAKADPDNVTWGGGSAGGTDQILVGLAAKAAGADTSKIADKYVAYSGGGESLGPLKSGELDCAVSGVSEYTGLIADGTLRALAVSGAEPMDTGAGETPTLQDAGYDVELLNWRGIVSPPGIADKDRDAIIDLITKVHDSDEWQEALKSNQWDDFFKTGDDAKAYFNDETERTTGILEEIGLAG